MSVHYSTRGIILTPALWWLACVAAVAVPSVIWYTKTSHRETQLAWQFTAELQSYLNSSPASRTRLQTSLEKLSFEYRKGNLGDKDALVRKLTAEPLIRDAVVHKNLLRDTYVMLSLFRPFAKMNDTFLLDKQGKIKAIEKKNGYNGGVNIYLPHQQYQQFFQSILFLSRVAEKEGIDLTEITITPSGTWTVSTRNGWTLVFGHRPDFTTYINSLRTALPTILARGDPVRFDFRYQNAIAVTYQ